MLLVSNCCSTGQQRTAGRSREARCWCLGVSTHHLAAKTRPSLLTRQMPAAKEPSLCDYDLYAPYTSFYYVQLLHPFYATRCPM